MGAGRGQIVGTAGQGLGEPQWCAVRGGDDLHIQAMPLVLL